MADNKFVRTLKRYATDGSPTGYDYVYNVNGQEVQVEVHAKVIHEWDVSVPEINQAVEVLIETEIGKGWSPQESRCLLLDEFSVKPIAEKLGWSPPVQNGPKSFSAHSAKRSPKKETGK